MVFVSGRYGQTNTAREGWLDTEKAHMAWLKEQKVHSLAKRRCYRKISEGRLLPYAI
jgi:hypothetical protein